MKPGNLVITTAIFGLVTFGANAKGQEVTSTNFPAVCEYGVNSFSPGARVREGYSALICTASGTWEATEEFIANCVFAGDLYSTGAVVVAGEASFACAPNGWWVDPSDMPAQE